MDYTPFAGLVRLGPGESLAEGGYAFQSRNPALIDRLLQIGAVTHRHDAHATLADPTASIIATAGTGGTGQLLPDTSITFGYTILDNQGGESAMPTPVTVTTPAAIAPPNDEPTAVVDANAGTLRAGAYYYALTLKDGMGGETTPGAAFPVTIGQGGTGGSVTFSGLQGITTAAGAAKWVLYRSEGGGRLQYLAEGAGNTFVDDGLACAVQITVPTANTTNGNNFASVTVPSAAVKDAAGFNVYATTDGSFASPALFLGSAPIASAGVPLRVDALQVMDGAPPVVSTMVPGAAKITMSELAADARAAIASAASAGPSYLTLAKGASGTAGVSTTTTGGALAGIAAWGTLALGSIDSGQLRVDADLASKGYAGYFAGVAHGPALPAAPSRKCTISFTTDSSGSSAVGTSGAWATAFLYQQGGYQVSNPLAVGAQFASGSGLSVWATDSKGTLINPTATAYSLAASTKYWLGVELTTTGIVARLWGADPGPGQDGGSPLVSTSVPFSGFSSFTASEYVGRDVYPKLSIFHPSAFTTRIDSLQFSPAVTVSSAGTPATPDRIIVTIPGGASAVMFSGGSRSDLAPNVTAGSAIALHPSQLEFVAGSGVSVALTDNGAGKATITIGLK